MNYHKGQRKVVITEDDNINHVNKQPLKYEGQKGSETNY